MFIDTDDTWINLIKGSNLKQLFNPELFIKYTDSANSIFAKGYWTIGK